MNKLENLNFSCETLNGSLSRILIFSYLYSLFLLILVFIFGFVPTFLLPFFFLSSLDSSSLYSSLSLSLSLPHYFLSSLLKCKFYSWSICSWKQLSEKKQSIHVICHQVTIFKRFVTKSQFLRIGNLYTIMVAERARLTVKELVRLAGDPGSNPASDRSC